MGTPFGYPDYQRETHVSGNTLFVNSNNAIPNGSPLLSSVFDVSSFDKVVFSADTRGLSGYYQLSVHWWNEQVAGGAVIENDYILGPGAQSTLEIACLGPKMYFELQQLTNVVDGTFLCWMWGTSSSAIQPPISVGGYPPLILSQLLGRGATMTGTISQTYIGKATLHVTSTPNLKWSATVYFWDSIALAFNSYYMVNKNFVVDDISEEIPLPATPIQISAINIDTGSHRTIITVTYHQ